MPAVIVTLVLVYLAVNLWAFEFGRAKPPRPWIENGDMDVVLVSIMLLPGYWIGRYIRWQKRMRKQRW